MIRSKNIRNCSIELLRIMLMGFILMHHFLVHGLMNVGFVDNHPANPYATFANMFVFVGVNCFVLISGYFGIKFKVKGLYKLFIQCASYGLLFYFLHLLYSGQPVDKSIWNNSLFVLSTPPGWWFIQIYVYLYLLSPMLNKIINLASKKEMQLFLCILTILNLYFGWIRQGGINNDGYNISNFIYLYFIGRYLNIHTNINRYKPLQYLAGYLATSSILGIIAVGNAFYINKEYPLLFIHCYNNPLLIISSVFLLLTFLAIDSSKIKGGNIIRFLSSSALSIYLITENAYFDDNIYGWVVNICHCFGGTEMTLKSWGILFSLALIIMAACLVIDKIRLFILHPLDKRMFELADKCDQKISNFLADNVSPSAAISNDNVQSE